MKSVHVLRDRDPVDHLPLVEVLRQRKLDEEPMDPRVGVETVHHREELALCRRVRQPDGLGMHAELLAGLSLHAHIDLARGVVAHQHHRQSRDDALRLQRVDVGGQLGAHHVADSLAINEVSGQCPPPSFPE